MQREERKLENLPPTPTPQPGRRDSQGRGRVKEWPEENERGRGAGDKVRRKEWGQMVRTLNLTLRHHRGVSRGVIIV